LSKIITEVEQSMTGLTRTDRAIISRFVFSPEFMGFQGHFPAQKVLPGACQIQCVLTTIGIANKKAVGLKEILLAKYFTPVLPHEEVTCTVSGIGDEGSESIYKAVVTKGAVKVAEMKLLVSLKAGKRKQRNI